MNSLRRRLETMLNFFQWGNYVRLSSRDFRSRWSNGCGLQSGRWCNPGKTRRRSSRLWRQRGSNADSRVLVDVGAHQGTVTGLFVDLGWSVIAYEPDPSNREKFEQRFGSHPRVALSSSAVSDSPAKSASFFTSPVSTGVSTLAAFHESHEQTTSVDVVTLAEDLRSRGLKNVDFLKIDIEGFDYFALKGFDWTYEPRFVLYEFENRKTVPQGYSLADSAAFVIEHGYHLVYSVWEPIVEYGTHHEWRGLFSTTAVGRFFVLGECALFSRC